MTGGVIVALQTHADAAVEFDHGNGAGRILPRQDAAIPINRFARRKNLQPGAGALQAEVAIPHEVGGSVERSNASIAGPDHQFLARRQRIAQTGIIVKEGADGPRQIQQPNLVFGHAEAIAPVGHRTGCARLCRY